MFILYKIGNVFYTNYPFSTKLSKNLPFHPNLYRLSLLFTSKWIMIRIPLKSDLGRFKLSFPLFMCVKQFVIKRSNCCLRQYLFKTDYWQCNSEDMLLIFF